MSGSRRAARPQTRSPSVTGGNKSQSSPKEQKRKSANNGSSSSSSWAHSSSPGEESPAAESISSVAPASLSLAAVQEACGSADLYLLLQLLGADSDENLQRAWFWNATRFVDAGVDDPAELGSLLATRITEDLLSIIYNKDTATLGFELEPACLKRFWRFGIDINAPLEIEPIQFRPPGSDLSPNRAAGGSPLPPGVTGIPTALHLASEVGHAGITNLLLQLRADPHIIDPLGQTPMCVAARQNFNLVVDELLRCDQLLLTKPKAGDAKVQEMYRRTQETLGRSLIVAAIEGNSKIVQQLLDAGADVDFRDPDGVSLVQHAASTGQLLVVQRAIAKGASLDNDSLCRACASGNLATVMHLKDAGMDVNQADVSGHTPLMMAAARGSLEIVEYLCLQGADVNHCGGKQNLSAIMLAAHAGHTPLVIYLSREWEAEDRREALMALPHAMQKRRMREQLEAAQLARRQAAQQRLEAQDAWNDDSSGDDDDVIYSQGMGGFEDDDDADEGDSEGDEGDQGEEFGDESFSEGDLEQLMNLADDPELRSILAQFEKRSGFADNEDDGEEDFEIIDVESESSEDSDDKEFPVKKANADKQAVPGKQGAAAARTSPKQHQQQNQTQKQKRNHHQQQAPHSQPSNGKASGPTANGGGRKRKEPEADPQEQQKQKQVSSPPAASPSAGPCSPRKRSKHSPPSQSSSPTSRRR